MSKRKRQEAEELVRTQVLNIDEVRKVVKYEKKTSKKPAIVLAVLGTFMLALGTAFQGKGYATEATKAVIDYGFNKIHFHKVQICVRPSNLSSKRVIEKCDFEYEGTLRDYFLINGEYEGRMYYSIIKK